MTPAAQARDPGVRSRAAIAAACAVAVLLAYSPVVDNGFLDVFDDADYVTANGYVRQGLTWDGVRWAFTGAAQSPSYWQPLTWLSLMVDVELFGVRPVPIHAENVLLHLAATLLLLAALWRTTGATWRSAAVALVFALHPVQVEAVAWAVERKAVLSGALGMGALLAYARWTASGRRRSYLLSLALFVASLMAKPQLLPFPVLLLLLDLWPLGRTSLAPPANPRAEWRPAPLRRLVLEKVAFAAASGVVALVGVLSRPDVAGDAAPLTERVAHALTRPGWYLAKLAWPAVLAPYYPLAERTPPWQALAAAVALAGGTVALWRARRSLSLGPLVGALWFLAALVPFSGLLRSGLWPGAADRFMYVPIVGAAICASWLAARLLEGAPRARAAGSLLAAGAVVALAARTHAQVRLWKDTPTLFGYAARVQAPHRVTLVNLGEGLKAAGRLDEARGVFETLSQALPSAPDGPVNLGVLLHERGDLEGAAREYERALARDPRCGRAHFNLGLISKRRGDPGGALASFERAVESGFRQPVGLHQLGDAQAALGRLADSERSYRAALRIDPLYWRSEARLGVLLASSGRREEAAQAFRGARRSARTRGDDPSAVDAAARAVGVAPGAAR